MTDANLEIVRRAIDALNRLDVDDYLALCTPDVQLVSPVAPLEGPSQGPEGVRAFFAGVAEISTGFHLEVDRLEAVGADRALALAHASFTSQTGVPIAVSVANVYDLVDGKLRRIRVFRSAAEALVAVGLVD